MSNKIEKLVESMFTKEINILGTTELKKLVSSQYQKRLLESDEPLQNNKRKMSFTIDVIPEMNISERGWGQLSTQNVGQIPNSARDQLEGYLKNIKGNSFAEKIAAINQFYNSSMTDLEQIGAIDTSSNSKKIQGILSYLVFLKTLTSIITNFNASSAGFTFEAFFSVLLNGKQVPAGGASTIADVIIEEDGKEVYGSLKLYAEKSLEVGGSYRMLINDLTSEGPKSTIRYYTGLKSLSGKDLELQGTIKFYQFDFTINNVVDILSQTSPDSKRSLILPAEFIESNGAISYEKYGEINVDEEKVANTFDSYINNSLHQVFMRYEQSGKSSKDVTQIIKIITDILKRNHLESDNYFKASEKRMTGKRRIGYNKPDISKFKKNTLPFIMDQISNHLNNIIKNRQLLLKKKVSSEKEISKFSEIIKNKIMIAYDEAIEEKEKQLSVKPKKIAWADLQTSIKYYNSVKSDKAAFSKALKNSLGYLQEEEFKMSKSQMINAVAKDLKELGTIIVGVKNIQSLLEQLSDDLDTTIFQIFEDLKTLSVNINKYFANGLSEDTPAEVAKESAKNIDKRTSEVQTKIKTNA